MNQTMTAEICRSSLVGSLQITPTKRSGRLNKGQLYQAMMKEAGETNSAIAQTNRRRPAKAPEKRKSKLDSRDNQRPYTPRLDSTRMADAATLEKRARLELQRRREQRSAFDLLQRASSSYMRGSVGYAGAEKLSKIQVLTVAIDYVHDLESTDRLLESQMLNLTIAQNKLTNKVANVLSSSVFEGNRKELANQSLQIIQSTFKSKSKVNYFNHSGVFEQTRPNSMRNLFLAN